MKFPIIYIIYDKFAKFLLKTYVFYFLIVLLQLLRLFYCSDIFVDTL